MCRPPLGTGGHAEMGQLSPHGRGGSFGARQWPSPGDICRQTDRQTLLLSWVSAADVDTEWTESQACENARHLGRSACGGAPAETAACGGPR